MPGVGGLTDEATGRAGFLAAGARLWPAGERRRPRRGFGLDDPRRRSPWSMAGYRRMSLRRAARDMDRARCRRGPGLADDVGRHKGAWCARPGVAREASTRTDRRVVHALLDDRAAGHCQTRHDLVADQYPWSCHAAFHDGGAEPRHRPRRTASRGRADDHVVGRPAGRLCPRLFAPRGARSVVGPRRCPARYADERRVVHHLVQLPYRHFRTHPIGRDRRTSCANSTCCAAS